MKKYLNILTSLIIFMVILIPGSVHAKSAQRQLLGDEVIFGGTFTLEENDVLDGSLIVFGGVVRLEKGSLITGDLVAFGSNIALTGEIVGNVVAIGGVLNLGEESLIHGDLIAPGTVLHRGEGAEILGDIITERGTIVIEKRNTTITMVEPTQAAPITPDPAIEENNTFVPEPVSPSSPADNASDDIRNIFKNTLSPITQFMWLMFRTFVLSAVAILLVLLMPKNASRISETIISQPLVNAGLGLLTMLVVAPVAVLLAITIILSPVSLLLLVLLSFGMFFGWIAVGQELGRKLGIALGQNWNEEIQAGVGTFIITFGLSAINLLFWDIIGWFFGLLILSVGLGAVIFTLFGTRSYPTQSSEPANKDLEKAS